MVLLFSSSRHFSFLKCDLPFYLWVSSLDLWNIDYHFKLFRLFAYFPFNRAYVMFLRYLKGLFLFEITSLIGYLLPKILFLFFDTSRDFIVDLCYLKSDFLSFDAVRSRNRFLTSIYLCFGTLAVFLFKKFTLSFLMSSSNLSSVCSL